MTEELKIFRAAGGANKQELLDDEGFPDLVAARTYGAIYNTKKGSAPGFPQNQLPDYHKLQTKPQSLASDILPPNILPSTSFIGGQTRKPIVKKEDLVNIGIVAPAKVVVPDYIRPRGQ